jgi:hypothetical protein
LFIDPLTGSIDLGNNQPGATVTYSIIGSGACRGCCLYRACNSPGKWVGTVSVLLVRRGSGCVVSFRQINANVSFDSGGCCILSCY